MRTTTRNSSRCHQRHHQPQNTSGCLQKHQQPQNYQKHQQLYSQPLLQTRMIEKLGALRIFYGTRLPKRGIAANVASCLDLHRLDLHLQTKSNGGECSQTYTYPTKKMCVTIVMFETRRIQSKKMSTMVVFRMSDTFSVRTLRVPVHSCKHGRRRSGKACRRP